MLKSLQNAINSLWGNIRYFFIQPIDKVAIRPFFKILFKAFPELKTFLSTYPRYFMFLFFTAITPLILAGILFFILTSTKSSIIIPQLEGLSIIDAATLIQDKNFNISIIPEDSDQFPQNFVIHQEIAAGRKIKEGRTLLLYVSNGSTSTSLPSIIGKDIYDVQANLQKQSDITKTIKIRNITWQNSSRPFGEILFQTPQAGDYRDFPIISDVVVSNGSGYSVPNYIGQYGTSAYYQADSLGLSPTFIFETITDISLDGKVIRQNPIKNTPIAPKMNIQLVVGKLKDKENVHYFEYKVDDEIANKTVALILNDQRGRHILYLGLVLPGDSITASSPIYGNWKAGIYIYEGENKKTLYKDLTV